MRWIIFIKEINQVFNHSSIRVVKSCKSISLLSVIFMNLMSQYHPSWWYFTFQDPCFLLIPPVSPVSFAKSRWSDLILVRTTLLVQVLLVYLPIPFEERQVYLLDYSHWYQALPWTATLKLALLLVQCLQRLNKCFHLEKVIIVVSS